MKRKSTLFILFNILFLLGFTFLTSPYKQVQFSYHESVLSLHLQDTDAQILLWFDEENSGNYYFFLPSAVMSQSIYFDELSVPLKINNILYDENDVFTWEPDVSYQISLPDMPATAMNVIFVKSENLPSLFLSTQSGDMNLIHSDKAYSEPGQLCILNDDGKQAYEGKLSGISGRGNSTWNYDKKPYSFRLESACSLCGLESGKKWCLLPVVREASRMNSKIAYDLANELDLAYSPDSTWIDLYLNGEYAGNYLLTESVNIGTGRVEINDLSALNKAILNQSSLPPTYREESRKGYEYETGTVDGGYLIEKDWDNYYEESDAGFLTDSGHCFTVSEPAYASRQQIDYIADYVQQVEDKIMTNADDIWDYVDIDSFVNKFLVDEISMNSDANRTSMYFYKEKNDSHLYAGPVWDYDNSFGAYNPDVLQGYYINYENTTIGQRELDWYTYLYENEAFVNRCRQRFAGTLPYFQWLINEGIDDYASYLDASYSMDRIRWYKLRTDTPGHYREFENNVRYLKYFLSMRIRYLCGKWDVTCTDLAVDVSETYHTVTFINNGQIIKKQQVKDGDILWELPELDEEQYNGWYSSRNYNKYFPYLPIYEDESFSAERMDED